MHALRHLLLTWILPGVLLVAIAMFLIWTANLAQWDKADREDYDDFLKSKRDDEPVNRWPPTSGL